MAKYAAISKTPKKAVVTRKDRKKFMEMQNEKRLFHMQYKIYSQYVTQEERDRGKTIEGLDFLLQNIC